jgi:dienelactone hydrolase
MMVRAILLLLVGLLATPAMGRAAEAVSFAASDHVQVFADYYSIGSSAKPLILLFHQAGSNRAEYATIGPKLAALGCNALAIDQRSGAAAWGRANETVEHLGKSAGYDEALRDLEAAVAWAKSTNPGGAIYAWGSSYSAALVFLLAAKHPQEIKAVLAFSPGEYLREPHSVRDAAAQLTMPIFVTSAKDSEEIAQAASILAAAPSRDKVQFVPRLDGVHGSSTLRPDRNPKGAAENWLAVRAFLARLDPELSRQTR